MQNTRMRRSQACPLHGSPLCRPSGGEPTRKPVRSFRNRLLFQTRCADNLYVPQPSELELSKLPRYSTKTP